MNGYLTQDQQRALADHVFAALQGEPQSAIYVASMLAQIASVQSIAKKNSTVELRLRIAVQSLESLSDALGKVPQ